MAKRRYDMKVGPEFYELRNEMKKGFSFEISDTDLTDGIARFLKERRVHEVLVRRANNRRRDPW